MRTPYASLAALLLFVAAVAAGQAPPAGGLGGGLGGRKLGGADPKAQKFELELIKLINDGRKKRKLEPLGLDEALRVFARAQAEYAARDDPAAKMVDARIKAQKLAPHGYRLQNAFGTQAAKLLKELEKEKTAEEAFTTEFGRIGVGAFWVPEDEPYFQVTILVVADADPMAGKPGLSREQTDAVMSSAAAQVKTNCYDPALRRDPNLIGSLVFQLVIGERGQVSEATLLSATGDEAFNACALGVARGLAFPAPYKGKPVTLTHPMRFAPPQGDKRVGHLSPAQISKVIHLTQDNIKRCYDARLPEKPRLAGTIVVALTVLPDGKLEKAAIKKDGPGDPELAACVLGFIEKLAFPPPEFGGTAEVEFPLSFTPPAKK